MTLECKKNLLSKEKNVNHLMRKIIITFTTWKINNKERWHLEKYFDHQKENMITIFFI